MVFRNVINYVCVYNVAPALIWSVFTLLRHPDLQLQIKTHRLILSSSNLMRIYWSADCWSAPSAPSCFLSRSKLDPFRLRRPAARSALIQTFIWSSGDADRLIMSCWGLKEADKNRCSSHPSFCLLRVDRRVLFNFVETICTKKSV